MRTLIAVPLLLAAVAGVASAAEQTPNGPRLPAIKAGTPYAQARKQMLAAGFVPYRIRVYRLVQTPCVGREEICRTYPEAADCAGTGNADCEFLFAKGAGPIVMIHTVGEQLNDLTVQEVRTLTRAEIGKMY
jgi:hypothetical protein